MQGPKMLNPTFVKRGATSVLTAGRSAMHCFITGPLNFVRVTHLLNSCATVLCPPINQHPAWWMATWIIWWPWWWTCCGSDVLSYRQHGFSLASEQGALLQTLNTAADSTRRPNSITSNSSEQSQVCCSLYPSAPTSIHLKGFHFVQHELLLSWLLKFLCHWLPRQ